MIKKFQYEVSGTLLNGKHGTIRGAVEVSDVKDAVTYVYKDMANCGIVRPYHLQMQEVKNA